MQNEVTRVIFRVNEKYGEVVAVFPEIPSSPRYSECMCYAHIGQHGGCTIEWYSKTRAAKHNEYADLLRELQRVGYDDLVIRKRWTSRMDRARLSALDN